VHPQDSTIVEAELLIQTARDQPTRLSAGNSHQAARAFAAPNQRWSRHSRSDMRAR
jgi:hypothetical protein